MNPTALQGAPSELVAVPREHVRPSRSLMVAILMRGLTLPQYGESPQVPLSLADVALLETLIQSPTERLDLVVERVATESGTSLGELVAFVEALDERSLLIAADDERSSADASLDQPRSPVDRDATLVLPTALIFRLGPYGFEHFGHDGSPTVRLTAPELHLASLFRFPTSTADAAQAHDEVAGPLALDHEAVTTLVERLSAVALLEPFDPDNPQHTGHNRNVEEMRQTLARRHGVVRALERDVEQYRATEDDYTATTGIRRMQVVPVSGVESYWNTPPLALGYLAAYAKAHRGGALTDRYSFHPRWVSSRDHLEEVAATPGIFLFSNYIWNNQENLELSALIKRVNPENVTVHGGPDTPKYEGDTEEYFRRHRHVDITVRGEGEVTFAEVLEALDGQLMSEAAATLRDVAGLSYRDGDTIVRTHDRDRIADLDTIPSPYLTGLFDTIADGGANGVVLETNRGCPYGCTFCDWGSATASRIRKFDLDRVLGELEWCATHEITYVGLADANFGIFARDVEIAEKAAELKALTGYPKLFGTNYAKNTVKHLRRIIEVLAEADILTEGIVSLQSMDQETLLTIKRSNIKLEKYDELATEFRSAELPLAVDLMLGLPGSTAESYRQDLQKCADREVRTRVYPTVLLPNSPMNEPSYREQYQINGEVGEVIKETSTYTRAEWDQMVALRGPYLVCHRYAVLRYVSAYVRSELGVHEVAFYEQLLNDVLADRERWPTIAFTFQATTELMAPPCSWGLFMAEVRHYLISVLHVADDDALDAVMTVQHAHLPSQNRGFPETVRVPHDFITWYQSALSAKENGHRHDWEDVVVPLRTMEPAEFRIDDPHDVCRAGLGGTVDSLSQSLAGWELGSPISRAR